MAKTITQLPDATSVADADELIVQQSGITKRATKLEVLAGIKNASIASDAAIAGTKVAPNFGSQNIQTTGNLAFGGTGNRITGDFSNAATADRVAFQTSVTNGNTGVFIRPNGTATTAQITAVNASSAEDCAFCQIVASSNTVGINSGAFGSGSSLPLTFQTAQAERMRIDASGNVGIGTTSPTKRLTVVGPTANGAGNEALWVDANTVQFAVRRESGGAGTVEIGTPNNHNLGFFTNGTVKMHIDTNGIVGIGTTAPNAAALLDVTSTTQGFLPPRMTTTERNAISAPPAGLVIYNTTTNKLNVRTASSWEAVTSS